MASPQYRKNKRDAVNGGNRAIDLAYNDRAGAFKNIGWCIGELTPRGDASTAAQNCELGELIAFYNDSNATVWLGLGLTAAAATTAAGSPSTSIAIPPRQYVFVSAGNNNWYRTSGACYSYGTNDGTYLG